MRSLAVVGKISFVCVLLLTVSAGARATLIDFDTATSGTLSSFDTLSTQYSAWGVTFAGYENGVQRDVYVDNHWGQSADGLYLTNYGPTSWRCCSTDRLDVVSVLFGSSVSGVSFGSFNGWGVDVTFQTYDTSGTFLGSLTGLGSSGWSSIDLSGFGNIGRIDILQGGDGYTYALDNLTYTASGVPEPSALLLIGMSVLGIGIVGRRRRSV